MIVKNVEGAAGLQSLTKNEIQLKEWVEKIRSKLLLDELALKWKRPEDLNNPEREILVSIEHTTIPGAKPLLKFPVWVESYDTISIVQRKIHSVATEVLYHLCSTELYFEILFKHIPTLLLIHGVGEGMGARSFWDREAQKGQWVWFHVFDIPNLMYDDGYVDEGDFFEPSPQQLQQALFSGA